MVRPSKLVRRVHRKNNTFAARLTQGSSKDEFSVDVADWPIAEDHIKFDETLPYLRLALVDHYLEENFEKCEA